MKAKHHLFAIFALVILLGASGCRLAESMPVPPTIPSGMPSQRATTLPPTRMVPSLKPGDSKRIVLVDNLKRTYLLHIPPGLTNGRPVALVFIFHGYSDTAQNEQRQTGFNDIADKAGFIVVYPVGSGPTGALSWNALGCCGFAQEENMDEPAFIRRMIVDLGTITTIDPKRIYATGLSNGGFLSYRLACEMSDTFAAVAPVAGALLSPACQPAQPVSVIAFHGLIDEVVPFAGGQLRTGIPFPATEQTIATWVQLDGCSTPTKSEQTAILTHTAYSSCKDGSAVELYALKNVGHAWPDQKKDAVPASQIIWDFFAAHPKP
jgi:polyhydroxybutyrate depolymerase